MELSAYRAIRRIHLRLCRAGRFGDAFGPANERTLVEAQNALANLRAALAKFGGAA